MASQHAQQPEQDQTRTVLNPYQYQGDDPVLKLQSQLKEMQWLSGMSDEEIASHCEAFKQRLEESAEVTDGD